MEIHDGTSTTELPLGCSYFCPQCGLKLTHAFGSRTKVGESTESGVWDMCEDRTCNYMLFVPDARRATHYSYGYCHDDEYNQWFGQTCTHWRDPIQVGKYTLTVSASTDTPKDKDTTAVPDFGVYMSQGWMNGLSDIWAIGVKIDTPHYPALYTDWTDYGDHDQHTYEKLVKVVVECLEMGLNTDIGCAGGHGRSGTLLAGVIAKVEGLSAMDAIEAARERHCKNAVETVSQHNMVRKLCGEEIEVIKKKEGQTHTLYTGNIDDNIFVSDSWSGSDEHFIL